MADDANFIPGIYNYCDRWCERCPLTGRCRLYATEQEDPLDPSARDLRNAAFWRHLHRIFERTRALLTQVAAEQGIDLNQVTPEVEEALASRELRKRRNPFARSSRNYSHWADRWLETRKKRFVRKTKELKRAARLALVGSDPEGDAAKIVEAVEVIRWYQHLIHVKLARAWIGKDDEVLRDEAGEPYPSDADGSAKVALLSIERSLGAWARLRQHFPDQADEILNVLVQLERLRRHVETEFPRARAFRRPGFDDAKGPVA